LLLRLSPNRHLQWPWNRELIAFGDPVVTAGEISPETTGGASALAQPLPYSASEISDIAKLARGTSRLYLGQNDLKRIFLDEANRAPLLHVSSHAFADGNNPENSRLLFSEENPDSQPVYVYLRELYDLDLSRVNLATISACDTERGKIIRGEGVQAFSRALLSAGADSAVTALWRVDDQATAEFMKQFYFFLLQENKPKAEALRLAKLKFLNSKSNLDNPAVWAAFVLNGDGLTPIPRVVSWTELAMSSAGLALILLALRFALRLRRRGGHDRQHHSGSVVSK
jgi:CHAT domain-containing protein